MTGADVVLRLLFVAELTPKLLADFCHRQEIRRRWVRRCGAWVLEPADDLRQWSPQKRAWVPLYLQAQVQRGGMALGAFWDGRLVGFGCIDGELQGRQARYANLTMLFVDDRCKRRGVGRRLFLQLCECAAALGANRVFVSAVPSEETVAFYLAMGCTDAAESIPAFVDTGDDRCLEYRLQAAEGAPQRAKSAENAEDAPAGAASPP